MFSVAADVDKLGPSLLKLLRVCLINPILYRTILGHVYNRPIYL